MAEGFESAAPATGGGNNQLVAERTEGVRATPIESVTPFSQTNGLGSSSLADVRSLGTGAGGTETASSVLKSGGGNDFQLTGDIKQSDRGTGRGAGFSSQNSASEMQIRNPGSKHPTITPGAGAISRPHATMQQIQELRKMSSGHSPLHSVPTAGGAQAAQEAHAHRRPARR